jgi:hypothetical protein
MGPDITTDTDTAVSLPLVLVLKKRTNWKEHHHWKPKSMVLKPPLAKHMR